MATWREQLQPASFRGVPFHWRQISGPVGRKTARHDYPGRDDCYIEDLGKLPREFNVEAYVLGAEYMAARDKLINALELPGEGELIHPTHGRIMVKLKEPGSVSESTDEGGMARFSLTFIRSGLATLPAVVVDTSAAVLTAADAVATTAQAEFAAAFGVKKAPEFLANDALATIGTIVAKAAALRSTITAASDAVTAVANTISNVAESATALISAPLELAAALYGTVQDLLALPARLEDALAAYRVAGDFFAGTAAIPRTTPSRIRAADNQDALQQLVVRAAVIEACRASATLELTGVYGNSTAVMELRLELADRLDLLSETASDPVYVALVTLRTAVIRDLNLRGSNLAQLTSLTPAATLPSLVLAHQLYGDATRADELLSRNRIRHPGFIAGGQPLEVTHG